MAGKLRVCALALCGAAFLPTAAWADEAAPDQAASENGEVANSNEIIVSARRRDERLMDAPVAITAFSGEALASNAATKFTDIATLVPGMVAGRAASGSSASVFLRGVGSTALSAGFDQSVSFLIDGIPLTRGREISLAQYDVSSLQVLKGPQALFFGKNTTGGLIYVTTNNPTNQFEAVLKTGYGFNAREVYGEGYISGPLSDSLRARIAVRASTSKGAFVNTADPVSTNISGFKQYRRDDRRGGSQTISGRLTLEYDASQNLSFNLKAGYTDLQDNSPTDMLENLCGSGRTVPRPTAGVAPSPVTDCQIDGRAAVVSVPVEIAQAGYPFAGNGDLYAHLKSGFAVLNTKLDGGMIDMNSITSYYRFKQTDLNNVSGQTYPNTFSQLADYSQFAQELRFQSKFDGNVQAQVGAFYAKSKFTFNSAAWIFNVPYDPVSKTYVTFIRNSSFDADSLSFFGELTVNLSEQLELSGGARYSYESRDSEQHSGAPNAAFANVFPDGVVITDRYRQGNLSPQATLRYKPSEDLTLYASYKQGFKAGGYNLSQSLTRAASRAAGAFKAESARGGELGLRSKLLDGALAFNATAFYYKYTDLQVQTFDPVTIGQIVGNAGTLVTKGLEADFSWNLGGGLSLNGAATYADVRYHDYIGSCFGGQTVAEGCNLNPNASGAFNGQNYEGRTPPKAPRFAGQFGAEYATPVGGDWELKLASSVNYTSSYNFTDTLRPDGVQKAFAKLNASLQVTSPDERLRFSLIGRNLTNKLVVTAANDIPSTGGTGTGTANGIRSDMSAFVDNPREIYIEVGIKF